MVNILFLSRHFPPIVSGGARRPYLLAKGLQAEGAHVRVIAPAMPEDVDGAIVPHPQVAPLEASQARNSRYKGQNSILRNWIRANLFLPDPDIRWALRAVAGGSFEDFNPDWLMTTSPPESVHVAGYLIARKLRAGWIADFRDNWLIDPLVPQRQRPLRRAVEKRIAKAILSKADVITAPSKRMLDEIADYAPGVRRLLLPQPGVLDEAAPIVRQSTSKDGDDPIIVLHTGSFSLSHGTRSIEPTLEVFAEARRRHPRFVLHLIGRLTEQEHVLATAAPGVEPLGVVTMTETWKAQRAADILLLAAAPHTDIVPGKISEYEASSRPIVVVGGSEWAQAINGKGGPLARLLSLADSDARSTTLGESNAWSAQEVARLLLDFIAASADSRGHAGTGARL